MAGKNGPTTFVPWYGSNRQNAENPGRFLRGCEFVGIGFAGGMCELEHIPARTILVNDLHDHLITTASTMADCDLGPILLRRLRRKQFDPRELARMQMILNTSDVIPYSQLEIAEAYYAACWFTRSDAVGTGAEYKGPLAVRYAAGGGDSVVRYRNACRSAYRFRKIFQRCQFSCLDVFEWISTACRDLPGHGYYFDPPFIKAGRRYLHNIGKTEVAEIDFQARLRNAVAGFKEATIVLRLYDHPAIRELYPVPEWRWYLFKGRDQANNADKPEVLITNLAAPNLVIGTLPPAETSAT